MSPIPGIVASSSSVFRATGGNEIVTIGSTRYHVFTSNGTFVINKGSKTVDIMCCGGGGVGARGGGAGGGGGGSELKLFTATSVTPASHTVTIGAGATAIKTQGGTTSIGSLLSALGGGYGGGWDGSGYAGGTGGSGGGAGNDAPSSVGGASGSNTRIGGTGHSSTKYTGGGGGGATTVGQSGSASGGGIGGLGYLLTTIDSNLTAANFPTIFTGMTYITSGGSGGSQAVNFTAPATGGGGSGGNNGTSPVVPGGNATSYGSGGGGGVGQDTNWGYGKAGIVIVKYTI
jgi:hypothetical protein